MAQFVFIKKFFFWLVYSVALVLIVAFLFFPKDFNLAKQFVIGIVDRSPASNHVPEIRELRIGLITYPSVIEPTSLDSSVRNVALQIYEPLVRLGPYFSVEPGLAMAWGRISPTVWRIELRPDAVFHNNHPFTVDDVISSFNRAAHYKTSDLKSSLSGLTLQAKGKHQLEITTQKPDPSLLQKISQILILPTEHEKKTTFAPVGTGSYKFTSAKQGTHFLFDAYAGYWGVKPDFQKLKMVFLAKRDDREKALLEGDVDLAIGVPPESVEKLTAEKLRIDVRPSLEVNFLTFRAASSVFTNTRLREAVAIALDKEKFVDFALGYATPSNQYVSSGVFGYHLDLDPGVYSQKRASEIVRDISGFDLIPVKILFTKGLEIAGDYVKTQLRSVGFDPTVSYVAWNDFPKEFEKGQYDISFFGWKSELGSVADFYQQAVHTPDVKSGYGLSNMGKFSDSEIDRLIEEAGEEFDDMKRLAIYRDIMKKLLKNYAYGVPLFEPAALYASRPELRFVPRADGNIVAQDIH